jgi:hypothetical protein
MASFLGGRGPPPFSLKRVFPFITIIGRQPYGSFLTES